MFDPYTIALGDRFLITLEGNMLQLQTDIDQPPLHRSNVELVKALANRIKELEIEIRAVLDGPLLENGTRYQGEALRCCSSGDQHVPLRAWEARLRHVLEQK